MNGSDILMALAALALAPLIGGILRGLDRILTARMQGRIGPPLWQPFYDFIKLCAKSKKASHRGPVVWAWAYLVLTVTAWLLFVLRQDLLILLFILAFAGASLALGAFSVRSPYAHFGAYRELLQMLAYEPILLLAAVAIFLKTGSFMVGDVLGFEQPLLISLPLTLVAVLIALGIKMRKSPFDIAASEHAHQELVRGVYTEYSGPTLALIELTHWYELVLVLGIISLFWVIPLWVGIIIALSCYFLEILIDNITARLRWSWMLTVGWSLGVGLILLNIVIVEFFGLGLRL
ncbi:MAG: NADH-quinone oxidoreductase subunit H [Peptococcaceae bacterium]|nr:NADH-quinone oxidoreductase subunit H [Peptococcaceae bacterium]